MQKDYEETAVVFGSPILCTTNGVSATTGDFRQTKLQLVKQNNGKDIPTGIIFQIPLKKRATLPETNSSPLKTSHPKRKLVFQPSGKLLVSGSVSATF